MNSNQISCISGLPVGMAGSGAPGPTFGVLLDIWLLDIFEVFCRGLWVCILGLEPPKSFFGSRTITIALIYLYILLRTALT